MPRGFTQAQMAAYMAYLRKHNPAGFKALEEEHKESLKREEERQRKYEEEQRLLKEAEERRKRMLIPTDLPNLDAYVFGMAAFRVWHYTLPFCKLRSAFMSYDWNIVSISDKVPTRDNSSGLHCIKLTALNLLTGMRNYFQLGSNEVCGLVELRGVIQEHTDGVLRAEWARILCLFITSDNKKVEETYLGLYNNYPGVPIYILNPEQLALLLIRETLKQKMRGDQWE